MRVAILNADIENSAFGLLHGSEGDRFQRYLAVARPEWELEIWQAKDGELPTEAGGHDGVLVTGSAASANDDEPWIYALKDFVRARVAARRPLFGACFGHQLIATALGGRVGPSPEGWRIGVTTPLIPEPRSWMRPEQAMPRLYCCNREQVLTPPEGVDVLGGDPLCPVALCAQGTHLFTTQFHPEMPADFIAALVERMEPETGARTAAAARAALAGGAEGALFAEWLARFFEAGADDCSCVAAPIGALSVETQLKEI